MRAQILLATHNPQQHLLERQLDSIRSQTLTDWTCLVFDDSSGDRDLVAELVSRDPRFRLLPATTRRGAYGAFELLLHHASPARPLFLCDQDDYWHPQKLQRMLEVTSPVFSGMRVVDPQGAVIRDRFVDPPHALTPAGILLMNVVSGAALKITPEVREAALPFPAPQWRGWHDQWLAAVAVRIGHLEYLDEALVDYTRHAAQVTGEGLRSLRLRSVANFARRPQLVSRVRWLQAAAQRLLSLPGPADPELEAIAGGRFGPLMDRYDIPRRRALLLRVGSLF